MNCEDFEPHDSDQRALTAAFAAMVDEAHEAPAKIERILLEAFVKRAKRQALIRRVWIPAGGAIAAAIIILAVRWRTPGPLVLRALPVPAPFYEPVPPVPRAAATKIPRHKPRRVRKTPEPAEVASEFYPIPYADPLTPVEHAEMVRVKVDDQLNAELIVGQDGLARAIRFINASR
ncbi:MAG: hypothetical protein M3Z85_03655 [Acidobacteriota bacterium]|nr:hypothetical protein [Acidobacteriota bacterium]